MRLMIELCFSNHGSNQKYVWFVSFWDEKLGVLGQADMKMSYFFKKNSGDD